MDANQYMVFHQGVLFFGEPCKHGHFWCSNYPGGRCEDEEYANLSESQREIVDNYLKG